MDDREAIEMMRRASSEIKMLRKQIDVLMPKADAYDMIGKILSLLPTTNRGYGEDVAYMLDKRIKELEKAGES